MSTDTDTRLEAQLQAMDAKLDTITAELAVMQRQRRELEELKEELLGISKDVFATTVAELEDVAPFVHTGAFKELGKRMLRNVDNMTKLVTMLESTMDFIEDSRPIVNEAFTGMLDRLDAMDRKGHFDLLRQGEVFLDGAAAAFQGIDVDSLEPMSTLQLFKEMRSREVRKGMTLALLLMKGMCHEICTPTEQTEEGK